MLVNPVVHPFVMGKPQFPEGIQRTELGILGTEIGPAGEDHVYLLADGIPQPLVVCNSYIGLFLKDRLHIVAAHGGRHIPLGHVADTFRILQSHAGHKSDIAQSRPAEARNNGLSGCCGLLHGLFIVLQIFFGNRAELFQVILRSNGFVVHIFLPFRRIDEIAARRHDGTGRIGTVATGINVHVAFLIRRQIDTGGNHYFLPPRSNLLV